MTHCGTKTIETERLILRRFTMDDAEPMFQNWASDPDVTKYLVWQAHADLNVTESVLQEWVTSYENNDFYNWAIVLKERGSDPIGSIGAVQVNDAVEKVHIGYCMGKKWWHRGIMSEALQAVLDYFFDEVGINRAECRHDARNPHSGMVMQKCGMKYEGTLRSSDVNNQGICDACWYALLRSER